MKNNYEEELIEIIRAFHNAGILENVIVIGSWATYFYSFLFENFSPTIRTTDLDFYVPELKNIKVSNTVGNALQSLNYDHIIDTLTNKSRFISPKGFEIEFLTKLRRDNVSVLKIDSLGVNVETLSTLDIFTNHYLDLVFNDISLKVASPSAYVIQKLLINEKRSMEKAKKDIESIREVAEIISLDKKATIELKTIFLHLNKKKQRQITGLVKANDIRCLSDMFHNL